MARYAMESSKQLAAGIINLGDKGYTTLSKYYPDLLSDTPNSPGPSNSGWKGGRLAASELENAGIVVVKDFTSRAVISQFRAHTSPISALCFDPSGTLLVTASVHGNNINIFRIIPSCAQTGSGNQTHDWSSAHKHLFKLHRGITTAVASVGIRVLIASWTMPPRKQPAAREVPPDEVYECDNRIQIAWKIEALTQQVAAVMAHLEHLVFRPFGSLH
ncbi:autophagy 18 G-like protein [Actinidia rufa]|uniref:Autophagy 18 G-like protein n=1 Tax=Actinidia rufa TaxID=165716 RepID=A0A7J0E2H7_9ERIC|nr:autophagy 18 G-like protein [Actinidia rufa]